MVDCNVEFEIKRKLITAVFCSAASLLGWGDVWSVEQLWEESVINLCKVLIKCVQSESPSKLRQSFYGENVK